MSETGVTLGQVEVGTALPELSIPITSSLIVGGALASRDFTPVHHDKAAAQHLNISAMEMRELRRTSAGFINFFEDRELDRADCTMDVDTSKSPCELGVDSVSVLCISMASPAKGLNHHVVE